MIEFHNIKAGTILTAKNPWYEYKFVKSGNGEITVIPIRNDNKCKGQKRTFKGDVLESFKVKPIEK